MPRFTHRAVKRLVEEHGLPVEADGEGDGYTRYGTFDRRDGGVPRSSQDKSGERCSSCSFCTGTGLLLEAEL